MPRNFLATAAVGALLISPAFAQQQPAETQQQQPPEAQQPQAEEQQQQVEQQPAEAQPQPQQPPIAQQCLEDLRQEAMRMEEEGYWLTGWGRRWGTGVGMAPPAEPADQPPTTGALDATPPAAGPVETTPPPRPGAAGVTGTGPWPAGPVGFGPRAPSYQIRTLYAAGNVLAHRGEEEACRAVLAELRTAYDEYVGYLQEAGVQPGEITTWRQEQMAAAQPITELQERGIISVDDVSGREVRNPQDERLGSVDDLIFDPESGEVSYAVIARGGFFGIGEVYVAVPWEQFAIAPGLNVLVLNIDEAQLEQAPEIDPDRFADPEVFTENRERTDQFWQQLREG